MTGLPSQGGTSFSSPESRLESAPDNMEPVNNFLHMVSLWSLCLIVISPHPSSFPHCPLHLSSLPTSPLLSPLYFLPCPLPSSFLPLVTWEKGHYISVAEKLLIQTLSVSLLDGICMGPAYPSGPYRTAVPLMASLSNAPTHPSYSWRESSVGDEGWALVLCKPHSTTGNPSM